VLVGGGRTLTCPIALPSWSVNHIDPSGPAVIPGGPKLPAALYLVNWPTGVIRPIELLA